MPTIDELVRGTEVELDIATKKRDSAIAEQKVILERVREDGRPGLTDEETAQLDTARQRRDAAKGEIKDIEERLKFAREAAAEEQAIERAQTERSKDPKTTAKRDKPAYDQVARVGMEERTYSPGNDKPRSGELFIRDVVRQFLYRDLESETRLVRHMQE